jgi:hypothetical protein
MERVVRALAGVAAYSDKPRWSHVLGWTENKQRQHFLFAPGTRPPVARIQRSAVCLFAGLPTNLSANLSIFFRGRGQSSVAADVHAALKREGVPRMSPRLPPTTREDGVLSPDQGARVRRAAKHWPEMLRRLVRVAVVDVCRSRPSMGRRTHTRSRRWCEVFDSPTAFFIDRPAALLPGGAHSRQESCALDGQVLGLLRKSMMRCLWPQPGAPS